MNKTALITGAAKRVGRQLALELAAQGWDIAAHFHRSAADADSLAAEIRALGRQCVLLQADLLDSTQVETLVPQAHAALGPLTLLVNNAARFERDELATVSAQSWQAHQTVNQLAPLLLIRDFAAQLPGDSQGNVINLLDGAWGWSLNADFLTYSASKQGLRFLTEFLAPTLAPRIRVNGIALGATLPGHQDKADTFARIAATTPLQQTNTVEDICKALRYLLTAETVTGQIVEIASGLHLRFPRHSI